MTPSTRSAAGTASMSWLGSQTTLQSGGRGRASTASRLSPLRGPTPPLPRHLGGRLNTARLFLIPLSAQSLQDAINGISKWQPSHVFSLRDLNRGTRIDEQKSPANRSNQSIGVA